MRGFVCCSCNAAQALYYAWESIIRKEKDTAQINLLLNRASPWLDLDSYLPYEGKIVIHNKKAKYVRIRLPKWVQRSALSATINGKPVPVTRRGKQIEFTGLKPKDAIVVTWPMIETTEQMGKYTCTFRGNTLCKMEPESPKKLYPYYQRDKYLKNEAPMIKVERYVVTTLLTW